MFQPIEKHFREEADVVGMQNIALAKLAK